MSANNEAARLAGWDPDDGDPPFDHAMPPADDPKLGNNGIAPTNAAEVTKFTPDGFPA